MVNFLEWIYGPAAHSDPYFVLLRDFWLLTPWWYPYLWLGILGTIVLVKLARFGLRRRAARAGIKRVQRRTEQLLRSSQSEPPMQRIMRQAANDDISRRAV